MDFRNSVILPCGGRHFINIFISNKYLSSYSNRIPGYYFYVETSQAKTNDKARMMKDYTGLAKGKFRVQTKIFFLLLLNKGDYLISGASR